LPHSLHWSLETSVGLYAPFEAVWSGSIPPWDCWPYDGSQEVYDGQ
jgi:hypothetical protein